MLPLLLLLEPLLILERGGPLLGVCIDLLGDRLQIVILDSLHDLLLQVLACLAQQDSHLGRFGGSCGILAYTLR